VGLRIPIALSQAVAAKTVAFIRRKVVSTWDRGEGHGRVARAAGRASSNSAGPLSAQSESVFRGETMKDGMLRSSRNAGIASCAWRRRARIKKQPKPLNLWPKQRNKLGPRGEDEWVSANGR
jgi:hypothetical protein